MNWNQKPYELYFHVQKTLQVTLTTSPGVVHKRIQRPKKAPDKLGSKGFEKIKKLK